MSATDFHAAAPDGPAHEQGLATFAAAARRSRLEQELGASKYRSKFVGRLPHFRDWDDRWRVSVAPNEQTPPRIAAHLRALGAPRFCWVVSTDPKLDARGIDLDAALNAVVGRSGGTVISCIPATLAYYEGEDPGQRFILVKKK